MSKPIIIHDGNLFIAKIAVEGGWVVNSYDKSHQILGSCFVPSLRTHLAGLAMQGLLANTFDAMVKEASRREEGGRVPRVLAAVAVQCSDELINALNESEGSKNNE